MERFLITGGKTLSGEIPVKGSKNAALKLMAASLLFDHPVTFSNIPDINDIHSMKKLIELAGGKTYSEDDQITLDNSKLISSNLDCDIAKRIRASIVLIGPLLARIGKASFPHPGGCVIGKRPIDYFVEGFKKLGARITLSDDGYKFSGRLRGNDIFLPFPSVTVTETLMMASAIAYGQTIIKNAAAEPEITQLAELLRLGGADISGAGTNTIVINGTNSRLLRMKDPAPFKIIPDRIEAGSFVILGALLSDCLKISNCCPEHIESLLYTIESAGAKLTRGEDWIKVGRSNDIRSVNITTGPYPSFATDLQSPFSIFLTQAQGESMIFETVFEGRLAYLEEIKRMGANIILCDPHRAIITGPAKLRAREMESPDLRAGLAYIIAALVAEGDSVVHNVYHIDRGYERVEERLRNVGASIQRVQV
ncbi:MAG: UDP-N-acetylglucosamine 1-carboxyvinyltransferase [Candidatus Niyogibacteria bacterium CG10_big_fil_rev_8_21_14_0_10_42_19]|uniref:UDP-N-acetylglucosamine 1-carboxyvinyltransferase n=1 Tax=Candidatus Niyogibacteria bacterium CG10_big_fil_rev_8_21_14_0_10_42_19 TaxID=1974725 RepID=A0A2H0THX6_9BACT|nr:MAG: UDP-N-acetylglucosamine 1-carboxyvinyltransferase [Candidatus Niyogibacteria bacterium CG10_big_fil_rev_8_21_14_0_10_42_19]